MILSIIVLVINILIIIAIFSTHRRVQEIQETLAGLVKRLEAGRLQSVTGPAGTEPSPESTVKQTPVVPFDETQVASLEICPKCGAFKPKTWYCYVCKGSSKQGIPITPVILDEIKASAAKAGIGAGDVQKILGVCLACMKVKKLGEPCRSCGKL